MSLESQKDLDPIDKEIERNHQSYELQRNIVHHYGFQGVDIGELEISPEHLDVESIAVKESDEYVALEIVRNGVKQAVSCSRSTELDIAYLIYRRESSALQMQYWYGTHSQIVAEKLKYMYKVFIDTVEYNRGLENSPTL